MFMVFGVHVTNIRFQSSSCLPWSLLLPREILSVTPTPGYVELLPQLGLLLQLLAIGRGVPQHDAHPHHYHYHHYPHYHHHRQSVPQHEAHPLEPVLLHHVLLVLLYLLHSHSALSEDQVSSFSVQDWKEASHLGTFEIRRYWRI